MPSFFSFPFDEYADDNLKYSKVTSLTDFFIYYFKNQQIVEQGLCAERKSLYDPDLEI